MSESRQARRARKRAKPKQTIVAGNHRHILPASHVSHSADGSITLIWDRDPAKAGARLRYGIRQRKKLSPWAALGALREAEHDD